MSTVTLTPQKAAYVRDGEHSDKNFLSLSPIEKGLELKTEKIGLTRHVLLSFDLTELADRPFRRVFFRPEYTYIMGGHPLYCDLVRISHDWQADTVTWDSKPPYGAPIYQNGIMAALAEMDVTEAVRESLKNGDRQLSLCMFINHPCIGNTRAALSADKTVLLVTDEERDEQKPRYVDDSAPLTAAQRETLPHLSAGWRAKLDLLERTSRDGFSFIVQTDPHMADLDDKEVANNVKALLPFTNASFVVNLGDIIRGYKYEADNSDNLRACMAELVRRYTQCPCPVLMAIGNHDNNSMWCRVNQSEDYITRAEHFRRVAKPIKAHNGAALVTNTDDVNGDSLYGYMDFDDHNVRVILVDSTDDGLEFNSFKVSETQVRWLEQVALNTQKKVMIMTHTPFFPEFPGNGNRVTNGDLVMQAVEAFIARGGNFIAYFYGHTHSQHHVTDANGRLHLSFLNGGSNAEAVTITPSTIQTVGFGSSLNRILSYR